MSEDRDERIGNLLRDDAPPERDALFRLGVLERRERQRFERRSLALLVAAVALAVIFWIGFNAGADLFVTAAIAVLCAALVAACVFSVPGVLALLHRMRGRRTTAEKN